MYSYEVLSSYFQDKSIDNAFNCINYNPILLKHINPQTEELCLKAIRKNPNSYICIKDFTDRVVEAFTSKV